MSGSTGYRLDSATHERVEKINNLKAQNMQGEKASNAPSHEVLRKADR